MTFRSWRLFALGIKALGLIGMSTFSAEASAQTKVSSFGQYEGYSDPSFEEFTRRSTYVPVRDGTRLALDVYSPSIAGRVARGRAPAVFEFTRYWRAIQRSDGTIVTRHLGEIPPGKGGGSLKNLPGWAAELLRHGYHVIVADNRGTGSSFGRNPGPLTATEARDAYDIFEWIAKQPWNNGRIGSVGQSITGTNQFTNLYHRSPHLKAMFPAVSNFELYRIAVVGGVFRKGGILAIYEHLRELASNSDQDAGKDLPPPVDEDKLGVLRDTARLEHGDSSYAGYVSFLYSDTKIDEVARELGLGDLHERVKVLAQNRELIPRLVGRPDLQEKLQQVKFCRGEGSFDFSAPGGERTISPHAILDHINRAAVPVYIWSGWNDAYPGDAFSFFANLSGSKKVTVGPWSHTAANKPLDPREAEGVRLRATETLRWFDRYLKEIPNGIDQEPRVNFAVSEDDDTWRWHASDDWPIPKGQPTSFYFSAGRGDTDGSLDRAGVLNQPREDSAGEDIFTVDYTATSGDKSRMFDSTTGGPLFYPDMAANDRKGLTYTTGPLDRDMTVVGHPVITLFPTSTIADPQFSVYLEDVSPSGHSRFVTEGHLRASHGGRANAPYNNLGLPWPECGSSPGRTLLSGPVEIQFDLQPTAWKFRQGHRIRVAIHGADADNNWTPPVIPPPQIVIRRGAEFPSRIVIPIVESVQPLLKGGR